MMDNKTKPNTIYDVVLTKQIFDSATILKEALCIRQRNSLKQLHITIMCSAHVSVDDIADYTNKAVGLSKLQHLSIQEFLLMDEEKVLELLQIKANRFSEIFLDINKAKQNLRL